MTTVASSPFDDAYTNIIDAAGFESMLGSILEQSRYITELGSTATEFKEAFHSTVLKVQENIQSAHKLEQSIANVKSDHFSSQNIVNLKRNERDAEKRKLSKIKDEIERNEKEALDLEATAEKKRKDVRLFFIYEST